MPGYWGTPLPKKLGLQSGFRVCLVKVPSGVRSELHDALAACTVVDRAVSPLDLALVFALSQADLEHAIVRVEPRLTPAGSVWAAWPKKSSGVSTDLDERTVRTIGLATGWVDVKVCAITEVWSGLKFVRRVKDRKLAC
jgi:hypothetical protein